MAAPERPRSRVVGVVLAAGRSVRYGGDRPKQLLEVEGEAMVRRTVRVVLASRLAEVVVVVGHAAAEVTAALVGLDLRRVVNPNYADGQSTSVRAGLAALPSTASAAMFLPADQPFLTPALVDGLIAAFEASGGPIVVPEHRGERGAPVVFARRLFPELAELRGDRGGRRLLPRHPEEIVAVEVDDPRELADVDTVDDLRRWLG